MAVTNNPLSRTQINADFAQPPPTVSLNFQNGCPDLHHLAIFDYVKWSRSEGEEDDHVLFSLDSSCDNMTQANAQFALAPNKLYLARAYFDMEETIEMIFVIKDQWNPNLHLQIVQLIDGPYFVNNNSFQEMTRQEADLSLLSSMHI